MLSSREETLRLEGFAESCKGRRIFCVAPAVKDAEMLLRGRLAALNTEVAHRGRKVLIVQGTAVAPKWLLTLEPWDAVFQLREVQDLKLALTYLQYAVKPTRVVWAGGEPTNAAAVAMGRIEGLSIVGVGDRPPSMGDWEAIFWSPSASFEDVEGPVGLRVGAGTGGAVGFLRSVLKELQASDVGLVWSAIGESDKRGALYWFDPREGVVAPPLDMRDVAEMLRTLADTLVK